MKMKPAKIFAGRTRDEWCAVLEGSDACFAPVLHVSEAAQHPHALAREAFVTHDGMRQPAPAPRFDRTPSRIQGPTLAQAGQHSDAVLQDAGFDASEIAALRAAGAVG